MTEKIEKYAIVGGGVATVALLILAARNQSGSNNPGASPVPVVLRSVSPEAVQIRGLKAQTDIAEINAKVSMFQALTGYNLGIDTNRVGLALGLDTNRVGLALGLDTNQKQFDLGKYLSDNDFKGVQSTNDANRFIADRVSQAEAEKARYAYEAERQKQKSVRNGNTWSGIGSIIGSFLSFI